MAVSENVFKCPFCYFITEKVELMLNHNCTSFQNATAFSNVFMPENGQPTLAACRGPSTIDAGCSSHTSDTSFESTSSGEKLERWEDSDCKLLIACWSDNKCLFGGKSTKKQIFNKIAKAFNKQSSHTVSGDQCLRKWGKMVTKHKEIQDHNNKTGNDSRSWKYYNELSKCLGTDATINPVCVMESSSKEDDPIQGDNQLAPDKVPLPGQGPSESDMVKSDKKRWRKRPNRSSAAEMLDFLKTYSEKREKTEEEKLTLLREMKEEKQKFFNRFFDYMEKK